MTAEEAYEADSTFRLLVDSWITDEHCPPPLLDRCMELDMPDAMVDCVRWAMGVFGRRSFKASGREKKGTCGVMPSGGGGDSTPWYWYSRWPDEDTDVNAAHGWDFKRIGYYLPVENVGEVSYINCKFPSALDAILWLLNNWKVHES